MQKTIPIPYLLKDFKRFLSSRRIKYTYTNPLSIQTIPTKDFPGLIFQFDKGEFEGYVKVRPVPVTHFSVEFKANTAGTLLKKLIKFNFLQSPHIKIFNDQIIKNSNARHPQTDIEIL